jgi:3D (Asp-Asp-Asp) domain-containing protein
MGHLSSYIKSAIKGYVQKLIILSIGCFIFGTIVDGISEYEKGNKVLRFYSESINEARGNCGESNRVTDFLDAATPKEKRRFFREVTAYNSVPGQTDKTPCISADGTNICERHKKGECIIAANGYPFNTRLRIDTVGICTVADRTHPKFSHRVDLFMDKDVEGAKNFGKRRLIIAELEK